MTSTILCQDFTFVATAHPIFYVGAQPVFVDSERDTWNMSPAFTKQAIIKFIEEKRKPKAILLVAGYGIPPKLNEFVALSKAYDIPIILDAAAGLGSCYLGMKVHPKVAITIFSFNGNKILSTGGGGAVVTNSVEIMNRISILSNQAKNGDYENQKYIGYNYRMSNICAAIGVGQLKVLDKRVQQRRANFDYYKSKLGDLPGVEFLPEPEGHFSNRWLSCITVNPELSNGVTRERIRLTLDADNIESRPLWKPLHLQPVFRYAEYFGNGVSEDLFQHGLCLPSGSNMAQADLDRVIGVIRGVFEHTSEDEKVINIGKAI